MKLKLSFLIIITAWGYGVLAQPKKDIVEAIIREANENSHLETLGMELMDGIGPRLIGSPQYQKANDWIVSTYTGWGVEAENQAYGEWKCWERGSTRVEMLTPRAVDLEAIQLAWCPATPAGKPVEAEIIQLPFVADSLEFKMWLKEVKGKIVLISRPEITGRPESNWKEYALEADYTKITEQKKIHNDTWNENLKKMGQTTRSLPAALEKAGAIGILSSTWTGGWGVNRIFSARTERIPHVDISMEDYNMLYRFLKRGITPRVRITTESKDHGNKPVHNTIGMIRGKVHPDEYVFLSAHLDSWDGSTGATDNGTGTILMMEVMRILKKVYPNPKRTIIVGHWGGEEQGLNGSRAYVADHPGMMEKISVLFNQDNGTGRITTINGNGFLDAYDYFGRWLSYVPEINRNEIKTTFPGVPGGGGSDYASFLAAGVPSFFLLSNSWDYGMYTWHTNRDSYDKIVFDEVRKNAETIAILVYMACEEPGMMSRTRAKLPVKKDSDEREEWPKQIPPERKFKS